MRWLKKFANNPLSVVGSTQISPATLRDLFYMKDIVWFEWLYAITEEWKVWSYPKRWHKGIFMTWWLDRDGYRIISLLWPDWKHKTRKIHRMVAETYLWKVEWKNLINHKNWIPYDNRVENLEWCTYSENLKHAYDTLNRSKNTKAIEMYSVWGNKIQEFDSVTDAHKKTNVNLSSIANCARWWKKNKTAWWYIWKYKLS